MPGTWWLVLLYDVSRNRQWVKYVFVQLSISFWWLHASSTCAVYDTYFPKCGAIWTLSIRRSLVELGDFVVAHFSNQILWFLTEVVDILRFLVVLQQHVPVWVIFELLNQMVELALFRFVSTCSTAECGMPGIRKSTHWSLPQLSLYWWTSFSRCCEFGTSVTRGNLGDLCILH